jgi:hypothetical protein
MSNLIPRVDLPPYGPSDHQTVLLHEHLTSSTFSQTQNIITLLSTLQIIIKSPQTHLEEDHKILKIRYALALHSITTKSLQLA